MATPRSREVNLSSFGPRWIDLLERTLSGELIELEFDSLGDRKRLQTQFYSLKQAFRSERPDLAQRYERVGAFSRTSKSGKPSVQFNLGRPEEDILAKAGLKADLQWPEPPQSAVASALEGPAELEAEIDKFMKNLGG